MHINRNIAFDRSSENICACLIDSLLYSIDEIRNTHTLRKGMQAGVRWGRGGWVVAGWLVGWLAGWLVVWWTGWLAWLW